MKLPLLISETGLSTLADVLPIAAIIFGFHLFILRQRIPNLKSVLAGFFYVLVGLTLFLVGLEKSLFPLGRLMAQQLTDPEFVRGTAYTLTEGLRWYDYKWVYLFSAAIGFATTIAEPALIAVAMKAHNISGGTISVWGLRVAVAIGVARCLSHRHRNPAVRLHHRGVHHRPDTDPVCAAHDRRSGIRLGGSNDLYSDRADGGGTGTGSGQYGARTQCPARRFRSHRLRQFVSDHYGHGLRPDRRLVAAP
jgi:hypothetical protein